MGMKKKLVDAFNKQINKELYSSYLYLSMASWCLSEDLPGFANWMKVQAQEEMSHAMILFNHVTERDGRAILAAIDKPASDFKGIIDVFEKTLTHEQFVTESINGLMDLAIKESDHAARMRLQWFVDEQVEEEANAKAILAETKRVKGDGQGLLMLDREKATRVFVVPAPLAGGAA